MNAALWLCPVLTSKQRHFRGRNVPNFEAGRGGCRAAADSGRGLDEGWQPPQRRLHYCKKESQSTSKQCRSSMVAPSPSLTMQPMPLMSGPACWLFVWALVTVSDCVGRSTHWYLTGQSCSSFMTTITCLYLKTDSISWSVAGSIPKNL